MKVDGVELEYVGFEHVGELFRRMAQEADFEVAEMSLSTLILMLSRGDDRLVGIPVFPSRAFRQSQIYVNAHAGINEPKDLIGRRVGVPEYQMTAALWIRAVLEHDYGIPPSEIRWQTGGLRPPRSGAPPARPAGRRHPGRIPTDKALEPMLDAGELDALIHAHAPDQVLAARRTCVACSRTTARSSPTTTSRTGLFPIMHTVVIRRDVYEARPDSPSRCSRRSTSRAGSAARACETSTRSRSCTRGSRPKSMRSRISSESTRLRTASRRIARSLEATAQFSLEQGLAERLVDVNESCAGYLRLRRRRYEQA